MGSTSITTTTYGMGRSVVNPIFHSLKSRFDNFRTGPKRQSGATKRRQYSEALKRQMVAETQVPGASVSIVARRHDVNSNQLFRWRRQLLPKAAVESGAMLPVAVPPDEGRPRRTDREGIIEIAFGCGAWVRLRGEVSSETLRQVIDLLR
jgi:transposase